VKRTIGMLSLLVLLGAAIGVATVSKAADDMKTMSWTGWISDSHCGAKGMSADHKSCAQACMKNGSQWVFVNGADKKVLTIHNQDVVNGDKDLGHQVTVTGHVMDDGMLHVDKIVPAT
jgi:hypothetical protein